MAELLQRLDQACRNGVWEDVQTALDAGAQIGTSASRRGHTVLHAACFGNNDDVLRILLSRFRPQLDINAPSSDGTPLHLACRLGHYIVAAVLIEKEADVMAVDRRGNTPLHLACAYNREFIVLELLDHENVNVNAQNAAGDTPLMLACGSSSLSVIRTLLDFRADVDIRNGRGQSALLVSIQKRPLSVVSLILSHDPNLELGEDNATPLLWACAVDRLDVVRTLLSLQARVNVRDDNGFSPLFLAGLRGSPAVIEALLQAGAVVSAVVHGRGGGRELLTDPSRLALSQILPALFSPNFGIARASQCLEEVRRNAGNDEAVRMFTHAFPQRLATAGLCEHVHAQLAAELVDWACGLVVSFFQVVRTQAVDFCKKRLV